ncbi:pilus assembly PilX family protein [Pseudoalteromonas luteoviolacea]|uniref:Pilus assembly protein PilX n=1 Tax=Pseudoalteromonas luteoviolacea S4054 TaxID=1129367 RepID=A0A0F6AGX4_9GAMM|nr:type IV fimbrial biogenesis protein PilX [Pseudoalteromonas luteoviolacea]AOT09246.1 pilus assembly protein PilX [Pseudoalteromonas luteoviolacea]AOT14158.1 pilus assembly protein PilX [Pseudoalteromonas luteoviolacea]AOT19074.1 pilus assembly protein PilX [Pseudoalteromonas luteoviolacea]KKE85046.1 hypothetical protein N479_06325 [Pseudoalteromonas luteoviolacea S4054]KZN70164.1 hypothetical protein N481_01435 [Pseudoalteromonas luteoviolacea S4047-1]
MVGQAKQQGMVLIVSMVLIVAVTSIAVTLMSSSTLDIKITNAAQERETAEAYLMGEVQRLVKEQKQLFGASKFHLTNGKIDANDNGVHKFDNESQESPVDYELRNLNKGQLEVPCPRVYGYTEGVVCNMTELTSSVEYGDQGRHKVTVVIGIGQEIQDVKANQ